MSNQTIFQFFHWYHTADDNLWQHVKHEAAYLSSLGITHCWLPPAYKSALGADEPGYAVYDLYDLGEFNQKGTVRTKYGTKDEYISAIQALHNWNIKVLADVVLNHRIGGDEEEEVPVSKVDSEDRRKLTGNVEKIKSPTRFVFPGRKGKYSDYIWDWHSFTGVCNDDDIFLIHNEFHNGEWENVVGEEKGNFDFLMGNDVEFRNPNVREELNRWGQWYLQQTGVDGLRLDAVKHISKDFFPDWIRHLKCVTGKELFVIGEYWKNDLQDLLDYIQATGKQIPLFDVPLHFKLYEAANKGREHDLRTIFKGTLVEAMPDAAITFVDNHDTQYFQSLESMIEPSFQSLAYALILLREQGTPVVFYPALYGMSYDEKKGEEKHHVQTEKIPQVEQMITLRATRAYGFQRDYLDHPNVIGWTREGMDDRKNSGMAVLLSNGDEGNKKMNMGKRNAGALFVDATGDRKEKVNIDENGDGVFFVNGGNVSVWVNETAPDMSDVKVPQHGQ